MAKGARPKIQDVARLAGVSLGTVSGVLNGTGRISESTRNRVQAAIAKLGYRPDFYASNLARRNTRVLGVVVSNLQNPFFSETAQAIEEEAERHGFQISLMATGFSPAKLRRAVERMLDARIAGLAVMTSEQDERARSAVMRSGIPSVFLDAEQASGNSASIQVDSGGGMHAAVSHLIALGHRSLLYVRNSQKGSGPPLLSHQLRDQGFRAAVRACRKSGLDVRVIDTQGPGADAGEGAIAAAAAERPFTAAIAVTDTVAMGIYRGLAKRRLRIPKDVSVVGFDNAYFCRFLNPPLTTVDISRSELSRATVAALMAEEKSAKPLVIKLPTQLIERESTAPPARIRSR